MCNIFYVNKWYRYWNICCSSDIHVSLVHIVKGQFFALRDYVTRWIIFWRFLKSIYYFMYMSRWFLIFLVPFCGENGNSIQVFACFHGSTSNFEDSYWNPLQNACFGIQEAAYDSVNCSVCRRWWWKIKKFWSGFGYHFSKWQADDWLSAISRLNWGFQFSRFSLRCCQSWKFWCGFL